MKFHLATNAGGCGWATDASTVEAAAVTCVLCLRALAEIPPPAPPFVPGRPVPIEELGGVRALGDTGRRAIERAHAGEPLDDRPRWVSVFAALEQEARVLDDGSPIRSSSDPARFERGGRAGEGGTVPTARVSGREEVLAVTVAIERACSRGWRMGGVELSPAATEAAFRAMTQGRRESVPIGAGKKHAIVKRRPVEPNGETKSALEQLAGEMQVELGVPVTSHHLRRLRGYVLEVIEGKLASEIEQRASRIPHDALRGYREIAEVLEVSVATVARWHRDAASEIPVQRRGRRVWAREHEVTRWYRDLLSQRVVRGEAGRSRVSAIARLIAMEDG